MACHPAFKILRVDLAKEMISVEEIGRDVDRKFIGGSGLAAKILWDETDAGTEPLSPANPLVFMNGPLTGTAVPGSGRHIVAAVSPLTDIWGEAHAGGTWGYALARTPYMGIVFKGKASRPLYLWVNDDAAELRDASNLWGKDTWEAHDLVKGETDPKTSVATIGQAGENMARMAAIMHDGKEARAAARCGLGAVMGSKMLKAVAIRGNGRPWIDDEGGLKESINRSFPRLKPFDRQRLRTIMTERLSKDRLGIYGCIKNWSAGEMEGFDEKASILWRDGDPAPCMGCRIGCQLAMTSGGQRHVHGEVIYPFGSNCLIDDMPALSLANELCNRYGLDTISAGQTIAFAMELYEKGILTKLDTEGIDLSWGNARSMLLMLKKMAFREGIGGILSEGVMEAARRIGGRADEYAIHVKGLEFPWLDPRHDNNLALQYATACRGADHLDGYSGLRFRWYGDVFQVDEEARESLKEPFSTNGVGKLTARCQNLDAVIDSLQVCKIAVVRQGAWNREAVDERCVGIDPRTLWEWLNLATGWRMSFEEMMQTGERIFNLKRAFNVRRGVSRKDDTLPGRILTCRRGGKGYASDHLPPLGQLLDEYYESRGWSQEGLPTEAKLAELGLGDKCL